MRIVAIDVEAKESCFSPWQSTWYATVVGVVDSDGFNQTLWFTHKDKLPTTRAVEILQQIIDDADIVVAHNWKYDMHSLRALGINFDNANVWCTMVAEYLLCGQDKDVSLSLGNTAERYGLEPKLDKVKLEWDRGIHTKDIDADLLEEYVLDDAQKALKIFAFQQPKVDELNQRRLIELQSEYIKVLTDIERNGFLFDSDRAKEIVLETNKQIAMVEDEFRILCNEPNLNLSSAQHKSAVLFGGRIKFKRSIGWHVTTLKTKPESLYKEMWEEVEYDHPGIGFEPPMTNKKGKNGYYSTDKKIVDQLNSGRNKILRRAKELLLEHSHLNKIASTIDGIGDSGLLNKVEEDGLIHPTLNNTTTATGRLSSSNPNSQNLPRGNTSPIKTCIKPRHDGIYQVDLSQIEWRAAAVCGNDAVMLKEINDKIDQHIQAVIDKNLMGLTFIDKSDPESKKNRDNAKIFNFRMIYGGSPYGFYLDPKMPAFNKKRWAQICAGFETKYSGLADYNNRNIRHVFSHGTLAIPTGRRFQFKKEIFKDGMWNYNPRQVKNYPVQGLAGGDILPLMAVIIRRGMVALGLKSKLILTVHDSLVFDYFKDELESLNKLCLNVASNLPKYIEAYFGFKWACRLDAESEIGPNYGSLKFYDQTK